MQKTLLSIVLLFIFVHGAYSEESIHYKLTEQSFKNLQEIGVEEPLLTTLKPLQDQLFKDKETYLKALEEKIGNAQREAYQKPLLNQARNFLLVYAPPQSIWANDNKETELEGPIIDLVKTIFADDEVPIRPKVFPWARAVRFMETGQLDLILTIFYSEERAKIMDFSIPFVEVPISVIVPKGKSFPFKGPENLIGREGLIVINASTSKDFDQLKPKLNLTAVPTEEQIIRMLEKGRADYAVGPKYIFLIEAQKLKLRDKIEVLPTPIDSRFLHFGFSKKSPFLHYLPMINNKIKQFEQDGTIANMVEKAITTAADQ